MKKVVQLKLLTSAAQFAALADDLALCNEQANVVAQVAAERGIERNYDLRKVVYADLRATGLGSQAAQHVVKKVTDALTTRRARARNGGYGHVGSSRYEKIMGKLVSFRRYSAQPFDKHNMSWDHNRRMVALTIRKGHRVTDIPFVGRPTDLEMLTTRPVGESDLLMRDGVFYLMATVDVEEKPQYAIPYHFIGVDMGIVQIASVADDQGQEIADWSGGAVTARRVRNNRIRAQLQRKNTRSAHRRLVARRRKESRFVRDVNHVVSKKIVTEAKRTARGIAVEDLHGIRDRVRLRKPQRVMVHSWAFAQLGEMLRYKALLAGVCLVQVDPAYTSQTCSRCQHRDKRSRRTQADFVCTSCGVSLNADMNAAVNIARRGVDSRVLVNVP